MTEETLFTRESAEALLPELTTRLTALRDAYAFIAGHQAKVSSLATGNGGDHSAEQWLRATQTMSEHLGWLSESGIALRDIEQGLIDFPAMHGGHEVFLCWRLGEDSIAWWHDTDTGFSGRQPLLPE
jgi:hypothetical protein